MSEPVTPNPIAGRLGAAFEQLGLKMRREMALFPDPPLRRAEGLISRRRWVDGRNYVADIAYRPEGPFAFKLSICNPFNPSVGVRTMAFTVTVTQNGAGWTIETYTQFFRQPHRGSKPDVPVLGTCDEDVAMAQVAACVEWYVALSTDAVRDSADGGQICNGEG